MQQRAVGSPRATQVAAPAISIAIVNWNALPFLPNLFRSLFDVPSRASFEVLMVDNGSQDGSVDLVREAFPAVAIISNGSNAGFAKANNQAIGRSRGRYVLLLNPDTVVMPGALDAMVTFLDEHPTVGAVGPCMRSPEGAILESYSHFPGLRLFLRLLALIVTAHFEHEQSPPRRPRRVDWVGGACLMVRRAALDQIGLLDEGFFMYWEEADLCFRLNKGGWPIYYLPGAEVVHHVGGCSAKLTDHIQLHGLLLDQWLRSGHRFMRKHYPGWLRVLFLGVASAHVLCALALWSLVFVLVPSQRERARSLVRAYRHAIVSTYGRQSGC